MNDKNESMLNFIKTCPYIRDNSLFFNFGNVEDGAHQMITNSDDVRLQRPYIDGSILKQYTFSIDSFRAIAYNPIVDEMDDENFDDFKAAQDLLDWIEIQNDRHNYPDFGRSCIIDEMRPLTEKPELIFVDTSVNPPTAIYRITIRIIYLDLSKTLQFMPSI